MRSLAVMLVCAVVVGCGGEPDEEQFAEAYADRVCDFQESCATAEFYWDYDDFDDCYDDVLDEIEDAQDFFDDIDCDYDAGKAERCLEAFRASCREIGEDLDDAFDDCDEVYDCDNR